MIVCKTFIITHPKQNLNAFLNNHQRHVSRDKITLLGFFYQNEEETLILESG